MRSTTALLSLLAAAPAVLASPIPAGLVAEWESRLADAARVRNLSPEAAAALADESGPSTVVIDNRHYTPSGAIAPSAVLATPRPIVTTYLMGLGATTVRVSTATGTAASAETPVVPIRIHDTHDKIEVVIIDAEVEAAVEAAKAAARVPEPVTKPAAAAEQAAEDASAEIAVGSPLNLELPESLKMEANPPHHGHHGHHGHSGHAAHAAGMPCYYAQLRRDYNDMMVISLVAVFLLIIVAVELCGDHSDQATDAEDAPVGAIKLADDASSEKRPRTLSVQASPVTAASALHPTGTKTSAQ